MTTTLPSVDDVIEQFEKVSIGIHNKRTDAKAMLNVSEFGLMIRKLHAAAVDGQKDKEDAERYRVLRDSKYQMHEDDPSVSDSFFEQFYGEDLDAAIDKLKSRFDAAMKQEQGQ